MTDPSIPDDATWRAASLAALYLRPVSNVYMENGVGVWEFTPPLTTEGPRTSSSSSDWARATST
jgi:hypothetical protein